MSSADGSRIDPATVESLFREYGEELQAFLQGVLRDPQAVNDAFQNTFAKMSEKGHEVRPESRKAWLFRVAFNEAMLLRRKSSTGERVLRRVAWTKEELESPSDVRLIRHEECARVRAALDELPKDQQQVVRMKIYEEKTFAVIAAELKIPLGTALARMRAGLEKMRRKLEETD